MHHQLAKICVTVKVSGCKYFTTTLSGINTDQNNLQFLLGLKAFY